MSEEIDAKRTRYSPSVMHTGKKNSVDAIPQKATNKPSTEQKNINQLDTSCLDWYRTALSSGLLVTRPMIMEAATRLSVEQGLSNFHPSQKWLNRFLSRNRITLTNSSDMTSDSCPPEKDSVGALSYPNIEPPPSGTLVHQGAEARLYSTTLYTSSTPRQCIVKERFVKTYRHPALDSSLSVQRMRAEVRLLVHCRKLGLDVPPVLQVDVPSRRIWLGLIGPDALTLHDWFKNLAAEYPKTDPNSSGDCLSTFRHCAGLRLKRLASALGRLLARLHANHVVHGDLTMANILVHKATEEEKTGAVEPRLAIIDFGLSSALSHSAVQRLPEEKAVDLYVFERALINALDLNFLSSLAEEFPQFSSPENLMTCILDAYLEYYASQATPLRDESNEDSSRSAPESVSVLHSEAKSNLLKLDEVRLRGRKRLMVG